MEFVVSTTLAVLALALTAWGYIRLRRVRVRAHIAYLEFESMWSMPASGFGGWIMNSDKDPAEMGDKCLFINITNLSRNDVEVTHIWFATSPRTHFLQPEHELPVRLRPDESHEVWIQAEKLGGDAEKIESLPRVQLSTGRTLKSKPRKNVPERGYIPRASQ